MLHHRILGSALARYLQFVRETSAVISDVVPILAAHTPCILTTWHGQGHVAVFAQSTATHVLLAPGPFGSVYAEALAALGIGAVRGGGGPRSGRGVSRVVAVRQLLGLLEAGDSVALTADLSSNPRIAELGAVALAKHSGRPIFALGAASSRRLVVPWRWDQPVLNLPFSRIAFAVEGPVHVEVTANRRRLEEVRRHLESLLHAAQGRAQILADGGSGPIG